ncbi:allose-6-phosphate isomerase/ribose-5-phosphate isomerase B [Rhodovastum atsumiense]|uniref:Ribose 5-phosphate isomerase B n=1 Tax=Rhodovastum atsumiense TaxID=504468 RepID=A0A5M6ILQ3_9PROT|nr:ribose 5-phosphate isomerase B [Rhodovastum atsumiense]KAA5608857.1 ribose 5-phosphate isomerase B [Rhodovastum atsumiense]CAH2599314.1 allose-6-phosphate isomerase/ribose-5-phosphate isomerase B [Rhodovastum atsumiense]
MDTQTLPVIALGSDHAGFALKLVIANALRAAGHEVHDLGPDSPERVDYPDYAHAVCRVVQAGQARFGVLICGSGVGMSIAANRHSGIRCVLAAEPVTARLSRAHNDANVLALGARLTGEDMALEILRAFLGGSYEGGRHDQRLAKLAPA